MIKVHFPTNYDNSAENKMVVDFYSAFFKVDIDTAAEFITNGFQYILYGDKQYKGKLGLEKLSLGTIESGLKEVDFNVIFGNGDYVSCSGGAELENGTRLVFSEIFTFMRHEKEVKIGKIESYTLMV